MNHELSLQEIKTEYHGTLKAYFVGFLCSILLTLVSFGIVVTRQFSVTATVLNIVGLALLQAIIQLLFFLHLGQEAKPRWESVVFYFMLTILLIIVLGSLWIMFDLNDRLMSGMHT